MRKKRNRYRTDKTRPLKTLVSWIKTGLGLSMVGCAALALSAALGHTYHALLEAPWLRVEEIEISGLKHLERDEVLNTLGVARNASMLTFKVSELAARLETLPWLSSAIVHLDLSGRIVVEVTERRPLVIVYADDFFLVDTEGKLFLRTTIERYPGLPLLTGFSGSNLKEGDSLPFEPFEALQGFLSALGKAQNWLPLHQISECRWIKDEGFIIYTTHRAIPIEIGWEDFDVKLQRLQRVFGVLAERQWLELVTRIDLDYSDRVYIGGHFPTPKGI